MTLDSLDPGLAPWWWADLLMRSTLVLLVVAGLLSVWPRSSAAQRHVCWVLALLAVVALPALSGFVPSWTLVAWPGAASADVVSPGGSGARGSNAPVSPGRDGPDTIVRPLAAGLEDGAVGEPVGSGDPITAHRHDSFGSIADADAPTELARGVSPTAWLGWLWSVGAALALLPLALGAWVVRRLTRRGSPAGDALRAEVAEVAAALGMARTPRVVLSGALAAPFTFGVLRPTVLLPRDFTTWPLRRRQLVLTHELGHILRCDSPIQALAHVCVALVWFQPLAWWARRRLRLEAELACDDLVMTHTGESESYARCLLDVARSSRDTPLLAAVAMARPSDLERRVRSVLAEGLSRRGMTARQVVGAAALALGVVLCCAPVRVLGEPAAGAAVAGQVWVVAQDGSADLETIGAALAVAAPGDTIRVGPGTYDERLTVEQGVLLVGAGADTTIVTSVFDPEAVDPGAREEAMQRMAAATTDAERAAIRREAMARLVPPPTVRVMAPDVTLRDLRITLRGRGTVGKAQLGAALMLVADGTRVEGCAIVGSPASGVVVEGDDIVLEGCLIAAVDSRGIAVTPGAGGAVTIRNCDLRDCRHRGITLERDAALVEGCRISGSAWHGIRYDDVSPTIRGNALFANERFGIYASGETAAQVTGNLFFDNEMAGIACWRANRDTITGNTFVYNRRSAIEILEASAPVMQRNVIAWSPRGVSVGNIPEGDADAAAERLALSSNLFFQCGDEVAVGARVLSPAQAGFEVSDPGFVDAAQRDFSLVGGGYADTAGYGAPAISLSSPWPVVPEEQELVDLTAELDGEAPAAPPATTPHALAAPHVEAARQAQDAEARTEALKWMATALSSNDPNLVHAGLLTFVQLGEVEFDRKALAPALRELARTLRGPPRVTAFYALNQAGRSADDLALLLDAVATEPGPLTESGSHLIGLYTEGNIQGAAADVVLELLASSDPDELREAMRGLWGMRVSAEIEARLLAISETRSEPDAIYFTLSTLPAKSEAVVRRLFRAAASPDTETAGRALWGLSYGVDDALHGVCAELCVALLGTEMTPARRQAVVRVKCLELLAEYGGPAQVAAVRALVEDESAHETVRAQAAATLEALEAPADG